MKTIGFVHYRVGERDGVSLEIEKRAKVFKELGFKVIYITGSDFYNRNESYIIKELSLVNKDVITLQESLFGAKKIREDFVSKLYFQLEDKLYEKLYKIFSQEKIDLIFVHNIFSLPIHLAASTALINILDDFKVSAIALHHDFWFEREKYRKSNYSFANFILLTLPPRRQYILRNQVINSIAQEKLFKISGIKAYKIGDYFDFSQKPYSFDNFNKNFYRDFNINKNDILVLHSTRILERKAVENAMFFVKELSEKIKEIKEFYIGNRKISKNSKVVLFISNFAEPDSLNYVKSLKRLENELKINVIWAQDKIGLKRNDKKYSFWDPYVFADFMTYTSIWEGFGNQLLEGIFYKKLIVLFEYPVYKKDIKNEGYRVISLGDKVTKSGKFNLIPQEKIEEAAKETVDILQDRKRLNKMVSNNFQIAKKNHDISLFIKDIEGVLKEIEKSSPQITQWIIKY